MILHGKASFVKCTRKRMLTSLLVLGHMLSLASCLVSLGRQTKNHGTFFVKQNNGPWSSSPSLLGVNGLHRTPTSTTRLYATFYGNNNNNNNNNMELGIQIAQSLMSDNDRGYIRLKEQLRTQFPLVPESLIDPMIRTTAQGFKAIAPAKLKLALQPGKMEDTVKPELSKALVDLAMEQSLLQNIPLLQPKEKQQMVEYLVDQILNHVLQQGNMEWILSTPEVRLQALEQQVQQIHQEMGWKRLLWYRLRQRLRRRSLWLVASILVATAVLSTFQPTTFGGVGVVPPSIVSLLHGMKACASILSTTIRTLGEMCFQNILQPFMTMVTTKFQLG